MSSACATRITKISYQSNECVAFWSLTSRYRVLTGIVSLINTSNEGYILWSHKRPFYKPYSLMQLMSYFSCSPCSNRTLSSVSIFLSSNSKLIVYKSSSGNEWITEWEIIFYLLLCILRHKSDLIIKMCEVCYLTFSRVSKQATFLTVGNLAIVLEIQPVIITIFAMVFFVI